MGEKRIENQQLLAVNAPDKWVTVFTDDNFPMKVKSVGGKKLHVSIIWHAFLAIAGGVKFEVSF